MHHSATQQKLLPYRTLGILIVCGCVLLGLFLTLFRNRFLYPDTYIYWSLTHYKQFISLFSGFTVDYFTLLKPFSWILSTLLATTTYSAPVLNIILLCTSVFLLLSRIPHKNFTYSIIVLSLFLVNGIIYLYVGRASTEIAAIFLIVIWLLTYEKSNNLIKFVTTILVVLTRTELLFVFLIKEKAVKTRAIILIPFLLFALLVALGTNTIGIFFSHIIMPVASIILFDAFMQQKKIAQKSSDTLIGFFTIWGLGSIISLLSPALLSSGLFAAGLLLLPFIAFVIISVKSLSEEWCLKFIEIALILALTYLLTASDSYRYFVLFVPLFVTEIILHQKEISWIKQERLLFYGTVLISCIILTLLFPIQAITRNYWQERFEANVSSLNQNETIYSTTPFITAYLGYRSVDICLIDVNNLNPGIYVIDDYLNERCLNVSAKLKDRVASMQQLGSPYATSRAVYIERYQNSKQTTTFYRFER